MAALYNTRVRGMWFVKQLPFPVSVDHHVSQLFKKMPKALVILERVFLTAVSTYMSRLIEHVCQCGHGLLQGQVLTS